MSGTGRAAEVLTKGRRTVDILWAPWRMEYVQRVDTKDDVCIFCEKPKQETDRENLILYRGKTVFVILNKYPYNNGHLMVVPYGHTSDIAALEDRAALEMWQLTNKCKAVLSKAFHPDGYNIGMNIGRTAGAGIDQHIHMHIVPRWNGDTNFMPIVGQTKVVSQALMETYDALAPHFRD